MGVARYSSPVGAPAELHPYKVHPLAMPMLSKTGPQTSVRPRKFLPDVDDTWLV